MVQNRGKTSISKGAIRIDFDRAFEFCNRLVEFSICHLQQSEYPMRVFVVVVETYGTLGHSPTLSQGRWRVLGNPHPYQMPETDGERLMGTAATGVEGDSLFGQALGFKKRFWGHLVHQFP
jgi:hypothetical protein